MIQYFASGDIHSFYDEWMIALASAGFDKTNPDHRIIVCGDLFDRGSQSKECYDFAKLMHEQGRFIYIRGNHEDLLYDCVNAIRKRRNIGMHHMSNGTIKTLAQLIGCSEYDLLCYVCSDEDFEASVQPVLEFIDNTTVDYFELGDKVFVHGWIPTTCDEDKYEIVDANWRDGGWREAR